MALRDPVIYCQIVSSNVIIASKKGCSVLLFSDVCWCSKNLQNLSIFSDKVTTCQELLSETIWRYQKLFGIARNYPTLFKNVFCQKQSVFGKNYLALAEAIGQCLKLSALQKIM